MLLLLLLQIIPLRLPRQQIPRTAVRIFSSSCPEANILGKHCHYPSLPTSHLSHVNNRVRNARGGTETEPGIQPICTQSD